MSLSTNNVKAATLQKSVDRIVEILNLTDAEFLRLFGCPADKFRELTRDPEFSFVASPLRRAVYLIRVFNGLAKLYGNNETDMQRWLRSLNNAFGMPPVDYVDSERKLEEIVSYIESSLSR